MGAAYIATVDSRQQTIEAMIGVTNADALVEGAVIPVEETYCARMLAGQIPTSCRTPPPCRSSAR